MIFLYKDAFSWHPNTGFRLILPHASRQAYTERVAELLRRRQRRLRHAPQLRRRDGPFKALVPWPSNIADV